MKSILVSGLVLLGKEFMIFVEESAQETLPPFPLRGWGARSPRSGARVLSQLCHAQEPED